MKRMAALVIITQLALLAGCSSISVNHDYDREADFASYKTYDWIPRPASATGVNSSLNRERIRSAVENELQAKGLRQSSADPDLLLAFHVGVENRIEVTDWGYTYPGRYYGWGGRDIDVQQYREGTLVVDLINSSSKQLVWRGSAQGTLHDNPTPEKREKNINNAVGKIFYNYPPKK